MNTSLPLERVTIIGTGILGTQIAMIAAFTGYKVKVFDSREEAFWQSFERIRSDLQGKGIDPVIPWDQWDTCARNVEQLTDIKEAVNEAELIIEAVPENLELKKKVFEELGEKAPSGAILATNSSSIPVSRLESSSGCPEHCLNIHFYFPLQGVNMVDIMGGTQTLPEVIEKGAAWIRSLGFIPLTVKKELLGFCFNRVWRAIKRETLYMWGNGYVDFKDVDRAWMVFTGMKEGPFALMDKVGLDVVYDIEMVYYRDSQDPKDRPPEALKDKIQRGELGVKSGKGFYVYPNPEYLNPDFLNPSE
ncbi:MAG: 3-hydroxyacyl-CoA dehydrogenase family protein [Promethearchaeota archaeon]